MRFQISATLSHFRRKGPVSCNPVPDFNIIGFVDAIHDGIIYEFKTTKNIPETPQKHHILQGQAYFSLLNPFQQAQIKKILVIYLSLDKIKTFEIPKRNITTLLEKQAQIAWNEIPEYTAPIIGALSGGLLGAGAGYAFSPKEKMWRNIVIGGLSGAGIGGGIGAGLGAGVIKPGIKYKKTALKYKKALKDFYEKAMRLPMADKKKMKDKTPLELLNYLLMM